MYNMIRVGSKRRQKFKVATCLPFQILPATVHWGEPIGSNLIPLLAIPTKVFGFEVPSTCFRQIQLYGLISTAEKKREEKVFGTNYRRGGPRARLVQL